MITDRVGDFIVRLQNAVMIGKESVSVPHSNHILEIAKKLKGLGYISKVDVDKKEDGKSVINVMIAYVNGEAKLRGVKRISKPGRRLYTSAESAHRVKGGTGARIISTPVGILSDSEARKSHVGGEDMFEIW